MFYLFLVEMSPPDAATGPHTGPHTEIIDEPDYIYNGFLFISSSFIQHLETDIQTQADFVNLRESLPTSTRA